jgi:hypothetical protein
MGRLKEWGHEYWRENIGDTIIKATLFMATFLVSSIRAGTKIPLA